MERRSVIRYGKRIAWVVATLRMWVVVWIGVLRGRLSRLVLAPPSLPELLVEMEW